MRRWIILAAVVAAIGAPAAQAQQTGLCPRLQLGPTWYGDNAARLDAVIDAAGTCHGNPAVTRPYAVFDWDNTMIKNDISDQTIFWLLRNSKIRQPPRKDWATTSRYMSRAGARALGAACGPLAPAGQRLPTGRGTKAAAGAPTRSSRSDWRKRHHGQAGVRAGQCAAHAAHVCVGRAGVAGIQSSQVRGFAAAARRAALRAPIGATWRVGSSKQTAWIRYYSQMRDLVATLKAAGIEPWIVSASPKPFADVWGGGIGIDPEHTIGVEQIVRDGRLTTHLKGCGPIADGRDSIITYVDGKRCFINKIILGIGRKALEPAPASRRQVIGAGDSDTDATMVRDATGAHIADQPQQARAHVPRLRQRGRPMDRQPDVHRAPAQLKTPYPCSTTAFVTAGGKERPLHRRGRQAYPRSERRDLRARLTTKRPELRSTAPVNRAPGSVIVAHIAML